MYYKEEKRGVNKPKIQFHNIETLGKLTDKPFLDNDFLIARDISPFINNHSTIADVYAFAFCWEGRYEVEVSFGQYSLTKGNIMFFKPGEVYKTVNISNDYKGILVSFSRHFFIARDNYSDSITELPYFAKGSEHLLLLSPNERMCIEFYIAAILKKAEALSHPNRKKIIRSLITAVLYELDMIYIPKDMLTLAKSPRSKEIARGFESLLSLYYKTEKEVSFYAGKLHVTPGYLSEVLRLETGKGALQSIREKLLLEAKILLVGSHKGIGEIAKLFSFENDSSFIRFFKKRTGMTPFEFRLLKDN